MSMIIDGIDFQELEAEKYWSFPKSFKGDPKEETRNMIFSGNYMGARKMDGAYYRFIKDMDGNMRLQGRSKSVSGEYLDKLDHVPHLLSYFENLPNGTCLLGEIYFPKNEGSSNVTTIMGCLAPKAVERQAKGPKLHYYIFDVWAYAGRSKMNTKIEDRVRLLDDIYNDFMKHYNLFIEVINEYENKIRAILTPNQNLVLNFMLEDLSSAPDKIRNVKNIDK